MTPEEWQHWLEDHEDRWRERWDPSDLAPQFIPHFRSGQRIKVVNGKRERTGLVGVTTGWKPAFLLIRSRGDSGSSDVLGTDDRVVAVQATGKKEYVPVEVGA